MVAKTHTSAKTVPIRKRATETPAPSLSFATIYKVAPEPTKNAIKAMVIILDDFTRNLRWCGDDFNYMCGQGHFIVQPDDVVFLKAAEAKLNNVRDKLQAIDVLSKFIGPDTSRAEIVKTVEVEKNMFVSMDMVKVVENASLVKEMLATVIVRVNELEFSDLFVQELQDTLAMIGKAEMIIMEAIEMIGEKSGVPVMINKRVQTEQQIIAQATGTAPAVETAIVEKQEADVAEVAFTPEEIAKIFEVKKYIEQELPGVSAVIQKATQTIEINVDKVATKIQTLIFEKAKFTMDQAKAWVKKHNFAVVFEGKAADETEVSFRFRQLDPNKMDQDNFRTITIMDGIKAVVGKPKIEKSQVEKNISASICKIDEDQRRVTGIVLEPETVDGQGDVISKQAIQDASEAFMIKMANQMAETGVMHKEFGHDIAFVESFVTKDAMSMNGKILKAGTWMVTAKVFDDDIWNKVKDGQLTGFSIGGTAKVEDLQAGA